MSRKLIDDCFRNDPRDKDRLSHEKVIQRLRERATTLVDTSSQPLSDAAGRIASQTVYAPIPVPGHTNSAVDGYAFAFVDYDQTNGSDFPVSARAAAGKPAHISMPTGSACRIFTGAIVPKGLDTVVMQEDCSSDDDGATVFVPAGLKRGANVRKAGEDVQPGTELITAGQTVRAPEIAALASVGINRLDCYEKPRVAIVSTGDELVRNADELASGQVYDVNAPLLASLIKLCGAEMTDHGIWPDNRSTVQSRLLDAAKHTDLILTSGGASGGEEDYMSAALETLGSRHIWQIAVKPGRPLMFGQVGDTVVIGLPGNPVAVFVCFLMYVWPLIRRLGGADWQEPSRYPLPANFTFQNRKVGRREFWRATTRLTPEGLVVEKFPRDGSGLISGLRAANGLIDVPEDVPAVRPGQIVNFIPFTEFGIRN